MTTPILNNQSFIYFDAATNTTSFYTPFDDHGFCIPTNYRDGFVEGLMDYFASNYGFPSRGYDTQQGVFFVYGWYSTSTDLFYMWMFNSKLIVDNFVVVYSDTPENFEYHIE